MPIPIHELGLAAREMVVTVPVSFESGEQVTGLRIVPPDDVDWRLFGARYEVTKALAGTDVGTIDVKDAAGNVAITQISIPLSSALGVRGAAVLSTTDSTLRAGKKQSNAHHAITSAKTTAGGKVLLQLYFRKIPAGSASN